MQIMIDTEETTPRKLRIYSGLLMGLAQALEAEANGTLAGVDTSPKVPEPVLDIPSPPRAATPPPPPPPPPAPIESNVLPFVPPPPPPSAAPAPSVNLSSTSTQATSTPKNSPTASIANSSAEPLEYDAAGMPWDARIHQRGKGQKKDHTWKLQKGIDNALVQSVVSELAAKGLVKIVSAVPPLAPSPGNVPPPPPPPPPPVATYVAEGSQPQNLPPVPAPPPPPPASADGSVITFKMLLDKITEATKAQKLDPMKITAIVVKHGAPNISALRGMSNLIPAVSEDVDLAIMGLG